MGECKDKSHGHFIFVCRFFGVLVGMSVILSIFIKNELVVMPISVVLSIFLIIWCDGIKIWRTKK